MRASGVRGLSADVRGVFADGPGSPAEGHLAEKTVGTVVAMRRRMRLRATVPSLLLLTAVVAPLRAADPEKMAAEALYQEAKKLSQAGKHQEACAKFAESHRIDPAIGTLLYLADCHEQAGRTASAWAAFREAESLAKRGGQSDRAAAAAKRAEALEPRLLRLTVSVPAPAPGLVVRSDGAPLGAALFGAAVPVDPGEHVVEASAPGKKPFRATVTLDATSKTVNVPALEDEARPAPPAASSAPPPPASTAVSSSVPDKPAPPPAPRDRTLAYVSLGVGGVGLVVGGIFGARAMSKWSASRDECRDGNVCTRKGLSDIDSAKSAATLSTVASAVGVIGLGVGGALLLFEKPDREKGVALGVTGTGVAIRGAF